MDENKVAADVNRSFSIAALAAFGIALILLLVAGLAKLIAWPIVSYIVKGALTFALLGGIGASLWELLRRSRYFLLKAFLILVSIVYLVVVSSFLALWFLPLKPEMGTVEDNIFDLVSILSGFAGLSLCELRFIVTGQATEPPKKGKFEGIIESALTKLSPGIFLMGGGMVMLLFALGMHLGPDPSNPYLVPTLVAGGSGGLILGVAEWLALRSPRLARWLMAGSGILAIALLYFFVRMFVYE